ncbi:uncharacterized protein LOC123445592 [Hordeum vulgare subsp. vulgare]|uniref:uncharacterized protein LOC123445592 n=1 Tax=Hordeum vulgare subsp. vulgare TaxID=112509 RepID=UPI001D1A3A3F|nr:uncharacterized protein LOC123445592 [Hordeum vulgare subsp. vulgare]
MAGVPEHGEGRVRYLVDTFERLLSLSRGDREALSGGGAGRRRRNKESASVSSSPRKAEEIDMASYPSVASSSDLSYCIVGLPRRNRILSSLNIWKSVIKSSWNSTMMTSLMIKKVTRNLNLSLRRNQKKVLSQLRWKWLIPGATEPKMGR